MSGHTHLEFTEPPAGSFISIDDRALITSREGHMIFIRGEGAKGMARHIVRAVNAHDELVKVLTRAVQAHGPFGDDSRPEWWHDANAILARATAHTGEG